MARQKGIFTIEGTLGNATFFKSKDGFMLKQKTEISKDRILNDPGYKRLQEHIREFNRAGKAAKQLRNAVEDTMGVCKDDRLSSRLTKLMSKVVKADNKNAKGERTAADGAILLLKNFDFNIDAPLSSILKPAFTTQTDRVTGNMTIEIPSFIPVDKLPYEKPSTHYKITSAGLEIDFANDTHVISEFESAALPIDQVATAVMTIAHKVTANSTLPLFLLLGIKYYETVNGVAYPLLNSGFNSLGIVDVDVV